MSTEPFIGEIKLFGFNFEARGYAYCSGQTMSIAQNTALFSLIGTFYGGNGQTTFNLPDLRGRVPIGQGQGPGLPAYQIGEQGGNTTATLTVANMPAHIHPAQGVTVSIPVSTGGADATSPSGAYLAAAPSDFYSTISTPGAGYGALQVGGNTGVAGSSSPFSIVNPYLVLNYNIALEGIFPSRN